jgi:hypothetical protein
MFVYSFVCLLGSVSASLPGHFWVELPECLDVPL